MSERPWAGFRWGGVCALCNGLLLLPAQWLPADPGRVLRAASGWREVFVGHWLCAEVLFLYALGLSGMRGRRFVQLATATLGFLWLYEMYDVAMLRAFGQEGVLYNDVLLLPDLGNLLLQLLPVVPSWQIVLGCALLAGVPWALARLLSRCAPVNRAPRRWPLLLLGLLVLLGHAERGLGERDNWVQSPLARLAHNLGNSWEMRAALRAQPLPQGGVALPPLPLHQRPNVFLFMVESYGSVVLSPPWEQAYRALMQDVQRQVAAAGFAAYSATSEAPVRGGRSWLSTATVLTGIPLKNQTHYRRVLGRRPYAMPAYFGSQGYRTIDVEPGTRARPGRPLHDPYGFFAHVNGENLAYRGVSYGWGVIPDHVSLHRAHALFVAPSPRPVFMFMMTVSSHAPWSAVPPWPASQSQQETTVASGFWQLLETKIRRRIAGEGVDPHAAGYGSAIAYDLRVIADYIARDMPRNTLVVIAGDHQPPFIAPGDDASTPVHLITDVPALLPYLAAHPALSGGMIAEMRPLSLRHDQLFGLLLGVLSAGDATAAWQ